MYERFVSFDTRRTIDRIRRSELSTPAHSTAMIAKAADSAADMVLIDLEDAVAPAAKVGARHNVIDGLNQHNWGTKVRGYRINGIDTPWCHGDIIDVVTGAGNNVDVIVVPKVRGPREVWFVDDLLTQLEVKLGLEPGRIGIECVVEEVEALQAIDEIARCSQRLEALVLGVGDLAASLGMRPGHIGDTGTIYPGDVWHYARNRLIVACRSAGIDAIDGPYADFNNPEGFESSAFTFATLGGMGKLCIHPNQIEVANRAFAPSQAEIDQAQGAIDAVRKAEQQGLGAASLNGIMIDAATARMFEGTIERARQCGLI